MDSLDLDFLNFEIINNTKICVLKTELGNVIKLRLNKDEEVIKINLIENDRLDLIGLFIPNLNNINFGDENYKSLNKDLIIRGNKIIINNIINKKIHVKIWNEGNINNTNDIKSLINLVFDVNYYLDPLYEEIEKLNKVYYNEGYLCIDGKIINTNLFKMLYSYDGIDYSYYNKAYLSDECNNVYIKTMNNDIYKSSEARIVIYGEKND